MGGATGFWGDAAKAVATLGRGIRRSLTNWVAFATLIVSAVAMAEIDRMIEQFLTRAGERYSMSAATGIPPITGAWFGWRTVDEPPSVLIGQHAAWDIAFAVGYTILGFRLYRAIGWPKFARAWWVLLGVEVTESVLEMWLAGRLATGAALESLVPATAFVSWVKWGALAVLLLAPLFPKDRRKELWRLVKQWFVGFEPHAPQLIGITALGVFALVPKPNLFDQYPDLVRTLIVDSRLDLRTLGDMLVAFGFFAGLSFWLGRLAAHAREVPVPLGKPGLWVWIVAPVVVVASLAYAYVPLQLVPEYEGLRPIVFAVAILLPPVAVLVVPPLSAVIQRRLRRRRKKRGEAVPVEAEVTESPGSLHEGDDLPAEDPAVVGRIRRGGDLVTGLVLLVFGAGLVRAFTAPVALRLAGQSEREGQIADAALAAYWEWALLVAGVLIAVLLPKLLAWAQPRLAGWVVPGVERLDQKIAARRARRRERRGKPAASPPTAKQVARGLSEGRMTLVFCSVITLLVGVFAPTEVAAEVGPVATMVIIVLLVVLIVWGLRSDVRAREANPVFRWMGFTRDPVLIVAVIVPALLVLIPAEPGLHPIQAAGDVLHEDRTLVTRAVGRWHRDHSTCQVPVRVPVAVAEPLAVSVTAPVARVRVRMSTVYVRPMLMIAAEGGGIRAAAWTARVVDELWAQAECDTGLVFLSSGVSGGAVGLTLSALADPGRGGSVGKTAEHPGFALASDLAGQEPLSASLSGLLLGDLAAGISGIRIPTEGYRSDDDAMIWQDRAAHLQWWWKKKVPALGLPYTMERSESVGWTVLNSSAVGYGCRVVISQLDLALGTRTIEDPHDKTAIPSCHGGEPGVANAIDLHELYGDCELRLDWATAALLSARFPLVSPPGHTHSAGEACKKLPDVQLSDGGIIDNSGLATIADLAPEVMTAVRNVNAQIPTSSEEEPWIVPILVYISNSPGGDVSPAQVRPWNDVKIALDAQGAGQYDQNSDHAWLQRIASQLGQPCMSSECRAAAAVVRATVGSGVAVIAPRTRRTVAAPLGWALSDVSLDAIDREVTSLAASKGEMWPTCFGELAHVVRVVNAAELRWPVAACRRP